MTFLFHITFHLLIYQPRISFEADTVFFKHWKCFCAVCAYGGCHACLFIKEIFGNKSPDDFDEETLTTINKFFENSLNVSETSRQLYIHRNTLVYRLDKLQKSTGLDLRVFEDAITFKIALMVVQYMKYMETLDY